MADEKEKQEKKTKNTKPMTLVEKWLADSKAEGGPIDFPGRSTK